MNLRAQLSQQARLVFDIVHYDLIQHWRHPLPLREEHHVYNATTLGVDLLRLTWQPLLTKAGVSLKISGVFCHQTPKASFHFNTGHPNPDIKRELADLLIVHDHTSDKLISRKALLIQTKMGPVKNNIGNPAQQYLYEYWPRFTLSTKAGYLLGDRKLNPNNFGSSVCFISKNLFSSSWLIANPWPHGSPKPIHIGHFLAQMVFGKRGFGRTADPMSPLPTSLPLNRPRNLHWSITIQELMDITANKGMSKSYKKLLPGRTTNRGNILEYFASEDVMRPPSDTAVEEEREDGGISYIKIETEGELLEG
jgi:hypothetical protein